MLFRGISLMSKIQALALGGLGGMIGGLPWLYPTFLAGRLPQMPPELPGWSYGVTLAIAAGLVWQSLSLWKRSSKPPKPAEGWAITEAVLQPLVRQGWTIQPRVRIKGAKNIKGSKESKGANQIDLLIQSPQLKYYCLSIQPHRGKINSDGRTIFRIYDHSQRPFEADFLGLVRQQANAIKALYRLPATPVIIFPEAIVEVQENPIAGVYVTGRLNLRACLLQIDRL